MNVDITLAWMKFQQMVNQVFALLPNIILGLFILMVFYGISKGLRSLINRVTQQRGHHWSLAIVLGRLMQWAVILIGLLISLSVVIPSFKASDLIQLLGIGSIAIGFAFRDIFQNFLAGILILLTEPFRIGDQIVVNNFEGTVEDIQTRATMIKTYDGRRVVIPNSTLFTQSVTVNTAFETRRSQYDIGIGYGDDIEKARQLIIEAMNSVGGVLPDPKADVLVVELADYNVKLRARWWTKSVRSEVLIQQSTVLAAIKKKLNENGIDLPFPTQQILFHDQTEETDGNRAEQREGWPAGKTTPPNSRWRVKADYSSNQSKECNLS